MTYEIQNRRLSSSSSKRKTCAAVPAFAENLFKLIETRDGSEYSLTAELRKEKMLLNAFDYIGVPKSSEALKGVVSRSKVLRSTLEPAVSTLQAMLRTLEKELDDVRKLEQRITTMCGLASLPTELLGWIFQLAIGGEDGKGPIVAITLSHVCCSFRNIVLRSPSLWANIDLSFSGKERPLSLTILFACLERSRNLPLDIRMKFDKHIASTPRNQWNRKYLEILVQLSHRWRSFEIELYEIYSQEYSNLFQATLNLDVPNLLQLDINSTFPPKNRNSQLEQTRLFSTWRAPKLRRLRVSNHLPFSLDQGTTFHNIEEALVQFNFKGIWNADRYLKALSLLPSLSQLILVFRNSVPFDRNADITPVSLNSVRNYRVELQSIHDPSVLQDTISTLSKFLGSLHCPNLVQLSLVAADCSDRLAAPLLSAISPLSGHYYPSLMDLSISISPRCKVSGDSTEFHLPLQSAPNLRYLSMSISSDFDISLSRREHSNLLKTLRFSSPYPKSVARWLRSFIGLTSEAKNWPFFETFILECSPAKVLTRKGEERMTEALSSTKVIRSEDVASWCREILNPYSKMTFCRTFERE